MKYAAVRALFKRKYVKFTIIGCLAIAVGSAAFLVLAYLLVSPNSQYILNTQNSSDIQNKHIHTGLVLGAGITKDGKPFRELQARLDIAADALQRGYIDTLILSGDNRYEGYDEPSAMKNYLIQTKHISADKLHPDYGGRSTYESCERAAKVFEQSKIIIISARSHLPRAIYLCRHFGVEAYGIPSSIEANNSQRREFMARGKAVFNLYVRGENTILGPPIPI